MERGCSYLEVVSWDEVDKAQRQVGGGFRLPRDPAGYLRWCEELNGGSQGSRITTFSGARVRGNLGGTGGDGRHGRLAGGPATGAVWGGGGGRRGRPTAASFCSWTMALLWAFVSVLIVPLSGLVANSRLAPTAPGSRRFMDGDHSPSRNSKKEGVQLLSKPPR